MCGISGYFSKNEHISGCDYYNAHNKIAHRGPDDEGFVIFNDKNIVVARGPRSASECGGEEDIFSQNHINACMSHVRLSIMDLSSKGHQPYISKRRNVVLCFNGEIYNYEELKKNLIRKGYFFSTDCDTEVVLASYEEYGEECFSKFNGMWAISIFDMDKRCIILSRDRFGIKPLFYSQGDNKLLFSSEIKTILAFQKGKYSVNTRKVCDYIDDSALFNDEETLFDGIYSVPKATYIRFEINGDIKQKKYWTFYPFIEEMSEMDAIDRFRELFDESLRLRMQSDVPVGSLLSGGLDSSFIAGMICQKYNISNYDTVSSVYKEKQYSEEIYINATKEMYSNLNTHYINVNADATLSYLDRTIYHIDEPCRSASVVAQMLLYKYISENTNIKVVLNGQGADELFGGYNLNYFARMYELLCQGRIVNFLHEYHSYRQNRNRTTRQMISGIRNCFLHYENNGNNTFNSITFNQITTRELPEYLAYDDRMSMSYGIEARAPFMDYRLVEFAFSLISDYKIDKEYNKKIVRKAAKGVIPEIIINRKDKMGFTSPQESWQRNEWKDVFEAEFSDIKAGIIDSVDPDEAINMYGKYSENKFEKVDFDYLWRWFCLSRWTKIIKDNV